MKQSSLNWFFHQAAGRKRKRHEEDDETDGNDRPYMSKEKDHCLREKEEEEANCS